MINRSRSVVNVIYWPFLDLHTTMLGSRVKIYLNDQVSVFHRPHPQKETDKGALVSVRRFLEEAGVKP
jgi:hypothetical protein